MLITTSNSLKKKQKIKNKADIKYILEKGVRYICYGYCIIFVSNKENYDRVGILVSRKIGNAILRNRVKRIFREIFRISKRSNPPYYDILIQVRPQINIENRKKLEICFEKWKLTLKTN